MYGGCDRNNECHEFCTARCLQSGLRTARQDADWSPRRSSAAVRCDTGQRWTCDHRQCKVWAVFDGVVTGLSGGYWGSLGHDCLLHLYVMIFIIFVWSLSETSPRGTVIRLDTVTQRKWLVVVGGGLTGTQRCDGAWDRGGLSGPPLPVSCAFGGDCIGWFQRDGSLGT